MTKILVVVVWKVYNIFIIYMQCKTMNKKKTKNKQTL